MEELPSLYDYQIEGVADTKKKVIYHLNCGAGKTYLLVAKIRKIGLPGVLICIKSDKKKWERTNKRFGLNLEVYTKEEFQKATVPNYNLLVYDEIHTCSMYTSGLFKAVHAYINRAKPEYILGSTATPYRSTPWNVFSYYKLFGFNPNYMEWRKRFFVEISIGGDRTILKPNPKTEGEVKMMLSNICFKRDVATGIPHYIIHRVPIVIPMMEKYGSIHDVAQAENRSKPMLDKLDGLYESGTLIVCYYTEEVLMLKNMYNCVAVSGKFPWKEEYSDVDKYPVIVVQADSATGWECPDHKNIIYFSRSWAYASYEQSMGRISRSNKFKDNYYHYLIPYYPDWNEKTVAEGVHTNLLKKQDFV